MKCKEVLIALPDAVRGAGSPEEVSSVELHLTGCEACSAEAKGLKGLMAELDHRVDTPPPDAYWNALLPRIHERIAQHSSPMDIPEGLRIFLPASVAIMLLVCLTHLDTFEFTHESQDIHSIMHQLQGEELKDAVQRAEIEDPYSLTKSSLTEEELFSAEKITLADFFDEQTSSELYADSDISQTYATNFLSEQEAQEIVTKLEQQ